MTTSEATDASTIAEIEETIARISSHNGVEGVMIMNRQGAIVKSTLVDKEQTKTQSAELTNLTAKASNIVALLNPDDELKFLRIRSKQREILVSPEKEYILVVIQNPNESE
mmetsp:Transcript_22838/g.48217  ORF Transcript_22838/g.48217 Transcript_22838/m.48217 type:complete len:111 (-) Transcript_22838:1313-1645(-)